VADRRDGATNFGGEEAENLLPVIQKAADHPCFECAKCCRYVAIEIDDPSSNREIDQIVWYLYHENMAVFVDWDNAWHVLFWTRCKNLTDAGLCGIYERRPALCKDFDWRECENHFTPEDGPPDKWIWNHADEFLGWLRERRPRAHARYEEFLRRKHATGEEAELLRVAPAQVPRRAR
jgi:Fe-S-cluster containining protein